MDSELVFRIDASIGPAKPSFLVGDPTGWTKEALDAFIRDARDRSQVFSWAPDHRTLAVHCTENPRLSLTIECWEAAPPDHKTVAWQEESATVWDRLDELSVSETGTGRWPLAPITFNWLPPGPFHVRCRVNGREHFNEFMGSDMDDDEFDDYFLRHPERYLLQIWPTDPETD
ncbi:hypothetical protein [Actinomadura napierensis]|uniref:Uncharacterized protein n=1 Tax=Actinomadura napierensis TaxID=267854 RepID=A0ABP5JQE5_9ACTN